MQPIERTVEAQEAFLESYFQRPNEYYFVIQRIENQQKEGLTSLLNVDDQRKSAEWGRNILRPDSLAAAESILLVLRLAFDWFHLDEVWGHTLANNRRVISFNESVGFARRRVLQIPVGGEMRDAIEYVLTRAQWPAAESMLDELSQIAKNLLNDKALPVQDRSPR